MLVCSSLGNSSPVLYQPDYATSCTLGLNHGALCEWEMRFHHEVRIKWVMKNVHVSIARYLYEAERALLILFQTGTMIQHHRQILLSWKGLLRKFVTYNRKKFYNIGPRSLKKCRGFVKMPPNGLSITIIIIDMCSLLLKSPMFMESLCCQCKP
jgi:hypothetical protein